MDKCPTCGADPGRRRTNEQAVLRAAEEIVKRALAEIRAEDDGGASGVLARV